MDEKRTFEQPGVYTNSVAELSAKLLEANKKLKEAEYERTKLIENISHDLRAPLTAIRSTVDLFKEKSHGKKLDLSEEEVESMMNLMDKRVKTLEVLIQDLYLMTCIDSGREVFEFKDIPLFQFLEEYFFAVEIDKKFEKYELIMDIPKDSDVLVKLDVVKMSRVLDNLFSNARKYSAVGSRITLGAGIEGNMAFFYLNDNGIGIPEEAIAYIFDRTYRVSTSRTPSDEACSGLGLSITRSIVQMHGGTIKCISKLHEGSRFIVSLPIIESQDI